MMSCHPAMILCKNWNKVRNETVPWEPEGVGYIFKKNVSHCCMGSERNCQNVGKMTELCNGRKEIKQAASFWLCLRCFFFFLINNKIEQVEWVSWWFRKAHRKLQTVEHNALPNHKCQFPKRPFNRKPNRQKVCTLGLPASTPQHVDPIWL